MKTKTAFVWFLLLCGDVWAQAPQPDGAAVRTGTLPRTWRTGGTDCTAIPEWEVHEYNADLYILRESGCVNYEKPFLYLLFGHDKALLLDTGAGETHVVAKISELLENGQRRTEVSRYRRSSDIPILTAITSPATRSYEPVRTQLWCL